MIKAVVFAQSVSRATNIARNEFNFGPSEFIPVSHRNMDRIRGLGKVGVVIDPELLLADESVRQEIWSAVQAMQGRGVIGW